MRDLDTVNLVVDYFNANRSTVRETAKHFGISKSTGIAILQKLCQMLILKRYFNIISLYGTFVEGKQLKTNIYPKSDLNGHFILKMKKVILQLLFFML